MAFRAPGQPRSARRPATVPRWPRRLVPAAVTAVLVIIAIGVLAGVWTNLLWFQSVGHVGTFAVTFGTQWALFAIAAVFMAGVIGGNAWLAYRLRPAAVRRLPGAAGPGGLPPAARPAPAAGPGRAGRPDRADLRDHRRGQLADLAAVRQPDLVRPQRPAVPPGHLVLRVRLPAHPAGAGLPVRGGAAVGGGGGRGALPVRRADLPAARAAGQRRGPGPPVRAGRGVRAAQGGGLLDRPVRHRLRPARRGADRRLVHRRERDPPGQDRAGRDRAHLRDAVPGRRGPAQHDAAGHRPGPVRPVGDPARRGLPGRRAGVRGQAQRAGQGGSVPGQGDHQHPPGLRREPGPGDQRQCDVQPVPQPAGQRGGRAAGPAAGRSRRAVPGLPAAPAGQELLQVPVGAQRGPVPGARRPGGRGHDHRRPGHERAAAGPGQLGQHAPGLHPRLRGGGRDGQRHGR